MKKDKRETEKCTAANERFGASGAVIRPKGSVDFQVLCLVSSVVEAPPSPSREALAASERQCSGQTKKWKIED
jgi:hypothetical protein